jgi:His/Glu/Gln/Arg/opine family amino acid ABC transporter permease subunit
MSFDLSVVAYGLPILLGGLAHTLLFCGVSIAAGLVLAVAVALARLSRRPLLRLPAAGFVELIRDTPFLVQAFVIFYGLPSLGVRLPAATAGILVLTVHASAYFSEAMRGAILSVPKGQLASARALGMPYLRAMQRIVFPQTLGYLLPALTNQIIGVIKESAVLSVITAPELSMAAQLVLGVSFSSVETYAMVASLYWLTTAAIAAVLMRFEYRFAPAARERRARRLATLETAPG